jgi:hypothetical protein
MRMTTVKLAHRALYKQMSVIGLKSHKTQARYARDERFEVLIMVNMSMLFF